MMRRHLAGLILVLLAAAVAATAEAQERQARIAYLTGGDLASRAGWLDAFRVELEGMGLKEGRNYTLDLRGAQGRFERLPQLAEELLRGKPDVLVASTTPGALAAKAATTSVPVVFVAIADPIGVGLVGNLGRPEANVTGVSNSVVELTGKRLEVLAEVLPAARRIAVLVNTDDQNAGLQIAQAKKAAENLGIALDPILTLRESRDIAPAIAAARRAGAGAALRLVDPQGAVLRSETARLALQGRLPVMFAFREDAEAGGLASYGTNQADLYRRAASFVQRILAGAAPRDLPVEQPSKFEFVVNQKTARSLGIPLSDALLMRADDLID